MHSLSPPNPDRVASQRGARNESNPIRKAGSGGAPSVFPRKPESRGWGGGANPDTNSFPRRHHPCYAFPMHSRTDRNGRPPPKAKRPHNPRLFSYLHPRLQTGLFPPSEKDTKREKAWKVPRLIIQAGTQGGAFWEAIPERIAQRCEHGRLPRRRLEPPLVPLASPAAKAGRTRPAAGGRCARQ